MANQIKYQVGFDIQKQGLNQLKSSLQQLQKMKFSDLMKINSSDSAAAKETLKDIKQQALKVENALKQAFNAKLGTTNIETFNKALESSGSSIQKVYQSFSKAGSVGESAFRSLSSQVLSTNIQLKQSHSILDNMATTLANTVKWNVASSAINALSGSVQQAFGYVKALDTSLNDIRIVTNKTAEDMGAFAEKANEVAQNLGKTTTDYTQAALIYAQQGLSDKEIEQRAAITLKTANVTGQSTAAVSEELTAV